MGVEIDKTASDRFLDQMSNRRIGFGGKNLVGVLPTVVPPGAISHRCDLEPIDSKEPDPQATFAKIVFEVYYPRNFVRTFFV
jgi:hypothetical protein